MVPVCSPMHVGSGIITSAPIPNFDQTIVAARVQQTKVLFVKRAAIGKLENVQHLQQVMTQEMKNVRGNFMNISSAIADKTCGSVKTGQSRTQATHKTQRTRTARTTVAPYWCLPRDMVTFKLVKNNEVLKLEFFFWSNRSEKQISTLE